jgi:zinc protease
LKRTIVPYVQYLARASTGNTYWLNQLKGASYDPRRIAAVKALGATLAATTPASLAETARKYLKPETEWTLAVLPKEAAGARPAGVQ